MGKVIDLTGQRFGRLQVVSRAQDYIQSNGRHRIAWNCLCDCDNQIVVLGENLRTNHTQSCGCLARETASKISRKYNRYIISEGYYIGYTSKGEEFYFDIEDYEKVKKYCWLINACGYVATNVWENNSNKIILMHRLIMGFPDGLEIDHIGGGTTKNDNRKSNLRIVTHSQNLKNVGIRTNNTSGVTGVSFDRQTKRWRASIKTDDRTINLGRFENFDDAVKARKEAEEKYFGEYSYDNSQSF